jgi:ferredoxin--NADP+ reductase
MPLSVAIVGSGPAGFYTAEELLKSGADVSIDIIERLLSPFGLIRDGVAPDHQTTKKISAKFERTALRDEVRYFGNVEVGRDVGLAELRRIYDAVVLCVGASLDRALHIPGEDKSGVYGSAAFVGWYNAHPDFRNLDPDLNTSAVAVVGVGNVAIDVARVLVKTKVEMAASDLPDYAERVIRSSPLTDVYMLGRRGPVEAKFTNVELREMGKLEDCVPRVDPAQLPDGVGDLPDRDRRLKEKNLATLREFAAGGSGEKSKRVHFQFYAAPVEILGGERVEGLRLERTRVVEGRAVGTGEFYTIQCGVVIAAVGYRAGPFEDAPFDAERHIVPNADGRVDDGLYAAGWIMRGPTGVISSNRADGATVAQHIGADFPQGAKPGREAFEKLLGERGVRWITYADWQKIDQAEIANAPAGAPRRKFLTVEDMLAVL